MERAAHLARNIETQIYNVVDVKRFFRHDQSSEDIQGPDSMAKGSSIRISGLCTYGKLSEMRDLLPDEPNASRRDFHPCEYRRRDLRGVGIQTKYGFLTCRGAPWKNVDII
jgi:hypothetical protein